MYVWVVSDIALLAWLKKKREGHVGEWFLTAKMIHGGMYTWHAFAAGVMGRAQLPWSFLPAGLPAYTHKGGKLPSILHSDRDTSCGREGTGQSRPLFKKKI